MHEIKNLSYSLLINFVNKSGLDSAISVKFNDSGLKVKSVKVGNVCVTEETINGRVLSGRIDNSDGYCGYKYDYQNGENLLNINPDIPINTAIALINKSKVQSDYLTAELVLSSIVRNDYRVVVLDDGNLDIIKTVSAENESSQQCCVQETLNLTKSQGEEYFVEQDKTRVYTIDDRLVEKAEISELSDIVSQSPQSYKELIEIKNQIQKSHTLNREKIL